MKTLLLLLLSPLLLSQFGSSLRLPAPISIVFWNSRNRQIWKNELLQKERYDAIDNGNHDPFLEAIKNKVLEKLEEFLYNKIEEQERVREPTWREQTLRLVPWRQIKRFGNSIPRLWSGYLRLYKK